MKATKKIVGAACALVAAVALSAGSTFAWFSTNSKVNVTGMEVQAVVPDALFIEEGVVDDATQVTKTALKYGSESGDIALPEGCDALNPARLYNGVAEDGENYIITGTSALSRSSLASVPVVIPTTWATEPAGNVVGIPSAVKSIGTISLATAGVTQKEGETEDLAKDYVAVFTMTVARINDKTDADLNAKVTIDCAATSGTTDNTWKFVRTAFYTTNGWVSIANTGSLTDNKLVFDYSTTNAVIDGDFDGNTPYVVQFMVWYDGDDADCYANNALTTHGLKVSIEYTVTDAPVVP